jgi:hypothetical protein
MNIKLFVLNCKCTTFLITKKEKTIFFAENLNKLFPRISINASISPLIQRF